MVCRALGGEADDAGRARAARFSRRRGTAFFAGRALSAAKPKADSTVAAANQRFQKSPPLGLLFLHSASITCRIEGNPKNESVHLNYIDALRTRRAVYKRSSAPPNNERFANGLHIRGVEFDLNQFPDAESIAGISPGREHN